jgi:transposase-like protein
VEAVSEQNYRRASQHLDLIGGHPVPKSTAHRWVVQSQADECDRPAETYQTLLVDGTGYKRRPQPDKGLNNRGEVRVAIGIEKDGKAVPLGSWSGKSWQEIGLDLSPSAPEGQKLAELLVSDQESGLAESLAELVNRVQPCHWHLVRDLGFKLWKQGAPLLEREQIKGDLAGILALEIPAGEVQTVPLEEKEGWKDQIKKAENQLSDLARNLAEKKYYQVAEYLGQIQKRLFGYLEFWLETGLVAPRTNSFLERLMRELGRRLKKIAFGWSEEGAAKMCRIILRRITDPEEWRLWWEEKMGLADNVHVQFRDLRLMTS